MSRDLWWNQTIETLASFLQRNWFTPKNSFKDSRIPWRWSGAGIVDEGSRSAHAKPPFVPIKDDDESSGSYLWYLLLHDPGEEDSQSLCCQWTDQYLNEHELFLEE